MFDLSPWLQLPLALVVALPLAGVAAAVTLRIVDMFAAWLGRGRKVRSKVANHG